MEQLESIEQIVKGLKGAVDNRLCEIEKGLSSQQNETIQKLTELLQKEREQSQELFRKYAHLKGEHLHLQKLVEQARERARQIKARKA
jgi:flagellar biosynthesis chaperone FliJ